jgi:hypothetical protein
VIEQVPPPDVRDPVQDSPVLAVTETEPVGPVPPPATLKPIVTDCWRVEGLGVLEVIVVLLADLTAVVR